jgi:hypothetical protein
MGSMNTKADLSDRPGGGKDAPPANSRRETEGD